MSKLALLGGSPVVDAAAVGQNPWGYRDLEDAFIRYTGARYALPVNSGTSAIASGLYAVGVEPGDEVLTVAFSWIAHIAAIFQFNGIPVFADVDRHTYTMDVADAARKITPQTKAILPVDIYGLPANIPALMELAEKHGIMVVEDAAQAGGAEIDGKKVGSLAHATAFSFGGKPISGWARV
jgi:dTDP-4-amino-4,6-dideoxygalactose transaminase